MQATCYKQFPSHTFPVGGGAEGEPQVEDWGGGGGCNSFADQDPPAPIIPAQNSLSLREMY